MNEYLKILFAPDCWVYSGSQYGEKIGEDANGKSIYLAKCAHIDNVVFGEFTAINEFRPESTRLDNEVTCFRNFLIEIDKIPLVDQATYIEEIGMPFSTAVYSGGKSIHYVISLEEPCKDIKEYRELASFLIDDVVTLADKTGKNPGRLSRTPDFIRPDTGRKQEILELRKRVTREEMLKFLEPYGKIRHLKKKAARKAARIKKAKQAHALSQGLALTALDQINARTKRFLANGAQEGDRHHELKLAMLDLHYNGADLNEIETLVRPAAELSGIGDRGDVDGLLSWLETKFSG